MADFDFATLMQNPMFMAGMQGLLARPQDRGQAMLRGALGASQMSSASQQQQLQAMKLKQLQAQQDFNPSDYMQTTPNMGTAVQDQQIAQQPAPMPAALGGPLGGAMQMAPQMQQPMPQPTPGTPTGRVDLQSMLRGGLQAGMSPAEVMQIGAVMDPQGTAAQAAAAKMAEPYNLGPGMKRMVGSQVVATNDEAGPNDPTAQLQRTMAAAAQARRAGNTALADQLDSLVQKQSGSFDQDMRNLQFQGLEAQRDIANAQRQDNIDLRKTNQDLAQAQRDQANQFQSQRQATALGTQLAKAGIPQGEQVLTQIEGMMSKYGKGDLPGFGPLQSMLPMMALSSDGQQLRQAVQGLTNVQLKDRSGAAVTDQEFERFKNELGSGSMMSEDRIRQGITHFRELLEAQKKNFAAAAPGDAIETYEENGGIELSKYRKPRARVSVDNATADDIAAAIRRKMGK